LAPVLPTMDENWNTCTILSDFLGCGQVTQLNTASPIANIGSIHNVLVNGSLYVCDVLPTGTQSIGTEYKSGRCIAWEACFGGGGKVIWLGLEWTHSRYEHSEMLKYLLNRLGLGNPAVLCSNPNLWTALWSNNKEAILFVMNLFSGQAEADIQVFYPDTRLTGLHSLSIKPFDVHAI
jgi:beta-galactosidase